MISQAKTISRFGYDPLSLSERSKRTVVRICRTCGGESDAPFVDAGRECRGCGQRTSGARQAALMRSSLEMRRKVGAGISKAKSAAEASLIAAGMKRCRGVEHKGEPRPLAEFPAGRSLAGKSTWCRGCTNAYMRKGSPGYRPETEADKFVARAWRKTPAGQALQSRCGFRRRARALGLEDSGLSRDEWLLVCNKFEWKCFRCSSPCAKSGQRAIDHHVPLTLWRPMSVANAVLLCTSCNSSKNNKHPRDFYTPEQVAALSALGVETL